MITSPTSQRIAVPQYLKFIGFELFLGLFGWFLASLFSNNSLVVKHPTLELLIVSVFLTIPPLILLLLYVAPSTRKSQPIKRLLSRVQPLIESLILKSNWWQLLLVSLSAGVGEEILFRGFLQEKTNIYFASVMFGLLHWISFTYAVFATLMGLYLGWLMNHYDSLFVPIVVHALYDFMALILAKIFWKNLFKPEHPQAQIGPHPPNHDL